MYKVAVYGTLRKGQIRHNVLENSKFLEKRVIRGLKMYSLEAFPTVVETSSGFDSIVTELYEVDNSTLSILDRIEGYSPNQDNNLYIREQWNDVNIYVMKKDSRFLKGAMPIESGDWVKHIKRMEGCDGHTNNIR